VNEDDVGGVISIYRRDSLNWILIQQRKTH